MALIDEPIFKVLTLAFEQNTAQIGELEDSLEDAFYVACAEGLIEAFSPLIRIAEKKAVGHTQDAYWQDSWPNLSDPRVLWNGSRKVDRFFYVPAEDGSKVRFRHFDAPEFCITAKGIAWHARRRLEKSVETCADSTEHVGGIAPDLTSASRLRIVAALNDPTNDNELRTVSDMARLYGIPDDKRSAFDSAIRTWRKNSPGQKHHDWTMQEKREGKNGSVYRYRVGTIAKCILNYARAN